MYNSITQKLFNKRLREFAGVTLTGKQRLRVVWGGNEPSEIATDGRLKYRIGFQKEKFWFYTGADGLPVQCTQFETIGAVAVPIAPEGCVPYEQEIVTKEVGTPHYIIEIYQSPEELLAKGRDFSDSRDVDNLVNGKPVKIDFPREGLYDCFFMVTSVLGGFRDLDDAVFNFVAQMYADYMDTSLEDKIKRAEEEDRAKEEKERNLAAEVMEGFGDWKLSPEDKERMEAEARYMEEHEKEILRDATTISVAVK